MNKLMIIAVLGAVLIIGGAVFFAKKEPVAADDPSVATSFDGEKIIVTEIYQSCVKGDRCIVVDTHCGFCCQYTAINARYEAEFNKAFDKSCGRFLGEYCQCFDLSSFPSCIEGKCQLVKWPKDGSGPASPPAGIEQEPATAPVFTPTPAPEPEPVFTPPPEPALEPDPQPQPAFDPVPAPVPEQMQEEPEPFNLDEGFDSYTPPAEDAPVRDESLYAPLPESAPPSQEVYNPLDQPLPSGNSERPW